MRGEMWFGSCAVLFAIGLASGQAKKPDVVAKLEGHRGGVSSISYSAKGNRIATGSGNGVVRVWDAKTGELIVRVDDNKHGSARITNVAFSADGHFLSSSSRTTVGAWDLADPKRLVLRYEDPYQTDVNKLGTVSGDGRLVYFTGLENGVAVLRTYAFGTRTIGNVDLSPKLRPIAIAPISDPESALVALYCATGEKGEVGAVALAGLGETRVLTKDVPTPQAGKPLSINFAPDAKWLLAGNGANVVYWAVPGSQVIEGEPRVLPGNWYVAVAGPKSRVAVATIPEEGKKVTVKIFEIAADAGSAAKVIEAYPSEIKRISALAFSPDGSILAVGDDSEGVVQLWAITK
jgi:WD40 repeat protein